MKVTDYCPRAAPFDSYLKGRGLVGAEVGVDVGAHAEALLTYCDIARLTLVDPWSQPYQFGYCQGRLVRFRARVDFITKKSAQAAGLFDPGSLDFLYIDQEHDAASVSEDLRLWWPVVKSGGVLGYRNYVAEKIPLVVAVDAFIKAHEGQGIAHVETGEIVLVKS